MSSPYFQFMHKWNREHGYNSFYGSNKREFLGAWRDEKQKEDNVINPQPRLERASMEAEDMNRAEPFAERQQRIAPKSTINTRKSMSDVLNNPDLLKNIYGYMGNEGYFRENISLGYTIFRFYLNTYEQSKSFFSVDKKHEVFGRLYMFFIPKDEKLHQQIKNIILEEIENVVLNRFAWTTNEKLALQLTEKQKENILSKKYVQKYINDTKKEINDASTNKEMAKILKSMFSLFNIEAFRMKYKLRGIPLFNIYKKTYALINRKPIYNAEDPNMNV